MSAPIVHAPCGPVIGVARSGSLAYLGIPYAEAPIGVHRFQAPVPKASWTEVRDATQFGATPQRRSPFANPGIPEPSIPGDDTLNLNIFTPSLTPDSPMPVHVYIHGGGYIAGSHVGSWFDGRTYNVDGIVVVTISYRLGFDGFGWIEDAPRNRGLRDMVCALEWVRDNIASFGGDPHRVTISGQSAGGGAVLSLLSMPSARGLFHGVIAHSPVIGIATSAQHEAMGREFAEAMGVPPTIAGWSALDEDAILTQQYASMADGDPIHPTAGSIAASVQALCEVTMQWAPAIDPDTLPVPPFAAWANGFNHDIPLMLGATADEFLMPAAAPEPAQARAWLERADLPAALKAYAANITDHDILGRLATTILFRRNVLDIAAARQRGGARIWLYDFVHVSASGASPHCSDLPFTWNCLSDPHVTATLGPGQPQALADAMHAAWVSFIRNGQPGWPEAGETGASTVFGGDRVAYEDVRALVRALPKLP